MRYMNKPVGPWDSLGVDFNFTPIVKKESQRSMNVRIVIKSEFKDRVGYCSVKVPKSLNILDLDKFKEHCVNSLIARSRSSIRVLEGDFKNTFVQPIYLIRKEGKQKYMITNNLPDDLYIA